MVVMETTREQILSRQSEPGWLLPYLWLLDSADVGIADMTRAERNELNMAKTAPYHFHGHGRWSYWLWTINYNRLYHEPIPQIDFMTRPHKSDERAVQNWLQHAVRRHYAWYDDAWIWLVKWLLFGFGYTGNGVEREIERLPDDLKDQWYRQVNLANLLNSPCDWSAFVLQGGLQADKSKRSPWSRSTGFFSTPIHICQMMTDMTMQAGNKKPWHDQRLETVLDPCVGTGSMLLPASNYSLRLYGQDIVNDLVLCCILNGYLFMPWLVLMPEETAAMLEDQYKTMQRLNVMHNMMVRETAGVKASFSPAPVPGVIVTDDERTVQLAEERQRSAAAYWEAARNGELEQMSMF